MIIASVFSVSCKAELVYYQVRFNSNGGTTFPVQSVPEGTCAYEVGDPVREGYTFEGWYQDPKFIYPYDFTTPVHQDLTLYAKWEQTTPTTQYAVTYSANGATSGTAPVDSNHYSSGATVTVLGNTGSLSRTGYSFAGWNTKTDGSGTSYAAGDTFTITQNTTLYAKWTHDNKYTVTYNANGATSGTAPVDSNQYSSGATVTIKDNTDLAKTDYTFDGWNTKDDGTGTSYEAGDTFSITVNTTLYAQWSGTVSNCIAFSSSDSFSISVSYPSWDGTIQYSTDGTTWLPESGSWNGDSVSSVAKGSKHNLYFRGVGNSVITGMDYDNERYWHIGGSNVSVSGNIMALLNHSNLSEANMGQYCFMNMFNSQSALISAEYLELPAMNLTIFCYYQMFSGCEKLEAVPELPATALANYCYSGMFAGCISLESAPILPATTLAPCCYSSMFSGCEKLATPPELPAGKLNEQQEIVGSLAESCYASMFAGSYFLEGGEPVALVTPCGLTKAPELPAMILADNCYESMFMGCTKLETAPSLPAVKLGGDCYKYMFLDCYKLKNLPANMLSADTLYVRHDSKKGRDVYASYEAMFKNCKELETAPDLPAMTLYDECYREMFSGCTSLTTAPDLPATNLSSADACYYGMFKGCTSLKTAPTIAATELGGPIWSGSGSETEHYGCFGSMFEGCSSLTSAPTLNATNLESYCYNNMFKDCTSLVTPPTLPASEFYYYDGYSFNNRKVRTSCSIK